MLGGFGVPLALDFVIVGIQLSQRSGSVERMPKGEFADRRDPAERRFGVGIVGIAPRKVAAIHVGLDTLGTLGDWDRHGVGRADGHASSWRPCYSDRSSRPN